MQVQDFCLTTKLTLLLSQSYAEDNMAVIEMKRSRGMYPVPCDSLLLAQRYENFTSTDVVYGHGIPHHTILWVQDNQTLQGSNPLMQHWLSHSRYPVTRWTIGPLECSVAHAWSFYYFSHTDNILHHRCYTYTSVMQFIYNLFLLQIDQTEKIFRTPCWKYNSLCCIQGWKF